MKDEKSKADVIIQLSHSQTAKSFGKNYIIQQDALLDVNKHFKHILNAILNFKDKLEKRNDDYKPLLRKHYTITISGKRGSGKTSFIHSIMKLIKNSTEENSEKLYMKLAVLGIIDPTILATKEHILINVISCIKTIVTLSYNENQNKDSDKYRSWKKSLEKLAGGLVQLDAVGSNNGLSHDLWDDPLLVLDEGLNGTSDGYNLENYFHLYVNESLKLLNKEAFVLAFDDIDTCFNSGWPVLEVIRTYLTTPQLIVLLSGDIELFSTLIRNEQWKHFNENILKFDAKGQENSGCLNFNSQIDELEAQYISKILCPRRRIYLKNIETIHNTISIQEPDKDEKGNKKDNKETKLDIYVEGLIKKAFFCSLNRDIQLIKNLIYNLPVRNFLQLLFAYQDCLKDKNTTTDNDAFNERLISVFISFLLKQDVSYSEYLECKTPFWYNSLAIKLLKDEYTIDSNPLFTFNEDVGKKILLLIQNRLYVTSPHSNSLCNIIDFWIKVELIKRVWKNNNNYNLESLFEKMNLKTSSNPFVTVRSFIELIPNKISKRNNIVFPKPNSSSTKEFIFNLFPNSCNENSEYYISIFNILSFIVLLSEQDFIKKNDEQEHSFLVNPQKLIGMVWNDVEFVKLDGLFDKSKPSFCDDKIWGNIDNWLEGLKAVHYPLYIWSDIFKKLYNDLEAISSTSKNLEPFDFLRRQILALFRAVLEEEYYYIFRKKFSSRKKLNDYLYNIIRCMLEDKESDTNKEKLPLLLQLLSCPLWESYLNPDNITLTGEDKRFLNFYREFNLNIEE